MLKKIKTFYKWVKIFNIKSFLIVYNSKKIKDEKKSIIFKMRNGIKLNIIPIEGDLTPLQEIFIKEDYRFNIKKKDDTNILDIGANIGLFSIYAKLKSINAKVFSFEPFPRTYERLITHIKSNSITNVNTYQFAVGDKNGKVDFYSTEYSVGNTMMITSKLTDVHYKDGYIINKVDCINLTKLFEICGVSNFDLAKIDCEGCEYLIILNSTAETICKISEYIIEVHQHNKYSYRDLTNKFKELGFETTYNSPMLRATLKN